MLICFRQTIINRILSPPPPPVRIETHYQDKLQVFDVVADAPRIENTGTNDISNLNHGELNERLYLIPTTVSHYACKCDIRGAAKREYSIKMGGDKKSGDNSIDYNTGTTVSFRDLFFFFSFSLLLFSLNETCRKYLILHHLGSVSVIPR